MSNFSRTGKRMIPPSDDSDDDVIIIDDDSDNSLENKDFCKLPAKRRLITSSSYHSCSSLPAAITQECPVQKSLKELEKAALALKQTAIKQSNESQQYIPNAAVKKELTFDKSSSNEKGIQINQKPVINPLHKSLYPITTPLKILVGDSVKNENALPVKQELNACTENLDSLKNFKEGVSIKNAYDSLNKSQLGKESGKHEMITSSSHSIGDKKETFEIDNFDFINFNVNFSQGNIEECINCLSKKYPFLQAVNASEIPVAHIDSCSDLSDANTLDTVQPAQHINTPTLLDLKEILQNVNVSSDKLIKINSHCSNDTSKLAVEDKQRSRKSPQHQWPVIVIDDEETENNQIITRPISPATCSKKISAPLKTLSKIDSEKEIKSETPNSTWELKNCSKKTTAKSSKETKRFPKTQCPVILTNNKNEASVELIENNSTSGCVKNVLSCGSLSSAVALLSCSAVPEKYIKDENAEVVHKIRNSEGLSKNSKYSLKECALPCSVAVPKKKTAENIKNTEKIPTSPSVITSTSLELLNKKVPFQCSSTIVSKNDFPGNATLESSRELENINQKYPVNLKQPLKVKSKNECCFEYPVTAVKSEATEIEKNAINSSTKPSIITTSSFNPLKTNPLQSLSSVGVKNISKNKVDDFSREGDSIPQISDNFKLSTIQKGSKIDGSLRSVYSGLDKVGDGNNNETIQHKSTKFTELSVFPTSLFTTQDEQAPSNSTVSTSNTEDSNIQESNICNDTAEIDCSIQKVTNIFATDMKNNNIKKENDSQLHSPVINVKIKENLRKNEIPSDPCKHNVFECSETESCIKQSNFASDGTDTCSRKVEAVKEDISKKVAVTPIVISVSSTDVLHKQNPEDDFQNSRITKRNLNNFYKIPNATEDSNKNLNFSVQEAEYQNDICQTQCSVTNEENSRHVKNAEDLCGSPSISSTLFKESNKVPFTTNFKEINCPSIPKINKISPELEDFSQKTKIGDASLKESKCTPQSCCPVIDNDDTELVKIAENGCTNSVEPTTSPTVSIDSTEIINFSQEIHGSSEISLKETDFNDMLHSQTDLFAMEKERQDYFNRWFKASPSKPPFYANISKTYIPISPDSSTDPHIELTQNLNNISGLSVNLNKTQINKKLLTPPIDSSNFVNTAKNNLISPFSLTAEEELFRINAIPENPWKLQHLTEVSNDNLKKSYDINEMQSALDIQAKLPSTMHTSFKISNATETWSDQSIIPRYPLNTHSTAGKYFPTNLNNVKNPLFYNNLTCHVSSSTALDSEAAGESIVPVKQNFTLQIPASKDLSMQFYTRMKGPISKILSLEYSRGAACIQAKDLPLLMTEWIPDWLRIQQEKDEIPPIWGESKIQKVKNIYVSNSDYSKTYYGLHLLSIWMKIYTSWKNNPPMHACKLTDYEDKILHFGNTCHAIIPVDELPIPQGIILVTSINIDGSIKLQFGCVETVDLKPHTNSLNQEIPFMKSVIFSFQTSQKIKTFENGKISIQNMYRPTLAVKQYTSLCLTGCSTLEEVVLNPMIFNEKIRLLELPFDYFNTLQTHAYKIIRSYVDKDNIFTLVRKSLEVNTLPIILKLVQHSLVNHSTILVCLKDCDKFLTIANRLKDDGNIMLAVQQSEVVLPRVLQQYTLSAYASKLPGITRERAELIVLKNSKIILTLLSNIFLGSCTAVLGSNLTCLIDDAHLFSEAETSLPLSYKPKNVILMGDSKEHAELHHFLYRLDYHKSLFHRLFNYVKK